VTINREENNKETENRMIVETKGRIGAVLPSKEIKN
jgi:hypothetical protein